MIRVDRPPTPSELAATGSIAARERDRVREHFNTPATRDTPCKKFKVYKHASVVAALEEMCHRKCAYCESSYDEVAPVEVEHYRPKGGVAVDGVLKTPGYWWLASEWTNLLPSCIDCNRARTQSFPDKDKEVSGKANRFPLADERQRATTPAGVAREKPLLLDPTTASPEKFLAFANTALVAPIRRNRRAIASIEVYGLNRDGLVRGRKRTLRYLLVALKNVRRAMEALDRHPTDPTAKEVLDEVWAEAEAFTAPDQPYAQMASQIIDEFKRKVS